MLKTISNGDAKQPENWTELFIELEKYYKEAYFNIEQAIKLDEEGKTNEALHLYESGLNLIDKALDLPLNEPEKPDLTWEKAVAFTQKLRKSRKEVVIRIGNIKSKPSPSAGELPPSYEDAVASAGTNKSVNNYQLPGHSGEVDPYIPPSAIYDEELLANLHVNKEGSSEPVLSYSDLSQQLQELKLAKNEEILFHCNNVQLYFIAPDGRVSSTSEPNTLIIARVHDDTCNILDETLLNIVSDLSREISVGKKRHKHHHLHRKKHCHRGPKYKHGKKDEALDQTKRTFLQVGSWVYPLIPEVSPCIRSEFGAFILPDINSELEGAAIGLILPESASEGFHETLTALLNEIAATGRARRSVETDFPSDNFSSKITRGAAYLAHNLVRGAGTTANFLDTSTPKIINRITPGADPQPINPAVQKTVEVAKFVSGKAVGVTDYLATKLGIATSALGRYLSPHIQSQGKRLLQSTTNMTEEEASQKINSMLNYTSEAVEGISTIYSGLDTAASILARSLANNTVQIIEYKYGENAGALTNDTITTFGNIYYTHHNFRVLKPRGIARAAVRGAGAAILEDHRSAKAQSKPHDEFQGSGPGDGTGFSPRT